MRFRNHKKTRTVRGEMESSSKQEQDKSSKFTISGFIERILNWVPRTLMNIWYGCFQCLPDFCARNRAFREILAGWVFFAAAAAWRPELFVVSFTLHESKALGIVASRPQARMAEDCRLRARRQRSCRNAQIFLKKLIPLFYKNSQMCKYQKCG